MFRHEKESDIGADEAEHPPGKRLLRPFVSAVFLDGRARGVSPAASSMRKMMRARDGVIVRALMAEMIVEAAIVTANCWKNRPVMPLMKAHGTKTAQSTR